MNIILQTSFLREKNSLFPYRFNLLTFNAIGSYFTTSGKSTVTFQNAWKSPNLILLQEKRSVKVFCGTPPTTVNWSS